MNKHPFSMKLRLPLVAACLLFGGGWSAPAQQTDSVSRTINQVYKFDEKGDAEIEVSFQYSASQWANWKEQYGNRPDIVLRDMRYTMATAVLENFSLEKDDVQRSAVGKVKARALARYLNGGEFAIDVPKEMRLVTGADKDWIFTFTNAVNGEIVSQTLHAKLPAQAHNARFTPSGDFNALTYTVDQVAARPKGWLFIGLACFGLAVLLIVLSLFFRKNRSRVIVIPPDPPSPQPPSQQPPPLPSV
jgi:hypothetical protein